MFEIPKEYSRITPDSSFRSVAKFELRHLGLLGAESMIPNVQSRELQPIQTLTPDAQGQILIPPGMTTTPVKEVGPPRGAGSPEGLCPKNVMTLVRRANGHLGPLTPQGVEGIQGSLGHLPANAIVRFGPAHLTTDVPAKKM